jgi:preprotein translocase subunit SecG
MLTVVTALHIIVSLGLIFVVLLQSGKGTDMGAVFGGSSSTIFGSRGAGNFLTRLTTGMAIVFMITSLTLGYFSGKRPNRTVFDRKPITAQASSGASTQETQPAQAAAPATPVSPQKAPSEEKK